MKKVLALVLAIATILSLSVVSFAEKGADDVSVGSESSATLSGGNALGDTTVNMKVDADATNPEITNQISVMIPLSVAMYGYGVDGTADEPTTYAIKNTGTVGVKVVRINAMDEGEWIVADVSKATTLTPKADGKIDLKEYDPAKNTLGTKEVALFLNGEAVQPGMKDSGFDESKWTVDAKGGLSLPLDCFVGKGAAQDTSVPVVTLSYMLALA